MSSESPIATGTPDLTQAPVAATAESPVKQQVSESPVPESVTVADDGMTTPVKRSVSAPVAPSAPVRLTFRLKRRLDFDSEDIAADLQSRRIALLSKFNETQLARYDELVANMTLHMSEVANLVKDGDDSDKADSDSD